MNYDLTKVLYLFFIVLFSVLVIFTSSTCYNYYKAPNTMTIVLSFNTSKYTRVKNVINYFENGVGIGGAGGIGLPELICSNFSQFLRLSGNSKIYYSVNKTSIKFMSVGNNTVCTYTYNIPHTKYDIYDVHKVYSNKVILTKDKSAVTILIGLDFVLLLADTLLIIDLIHNIR